MSVVMMTNPVAPTSARMTRDENFNAEMRLEQTLFTGVLKDGESQLTQGSGMLSVGEIQSRLNSR
jgi:hypothetical protein